MIRLIRADLTTVELASDPAIPDALRGDVLTDAGVVYVMAGWDADAEPPVRVYREAA